MNPEFYQDSAQGEESKEFDYIYSRIQLTNGVFRELELRVKRMLSVWPQYWKQGRAVPEELKIETRACLIDLVGALIPEISSEEEVLDVKRYNIKAIREERNRQIKERAKQYT